MKIIAQHLEVKAHGEIGSCITLIPEGYEHEPMKWFKMFILDDEKDSTMECTLFNRRFRIKVKGLLDKLEIKQIGEFRESWGWRRKWKYYRKET